MSVSKLQGPTDHVALQMKEWWRVRVMGEPSEPVPPSGYMTLIPLNGVHQS